MRASILCIAFLASGSVAAAEYQVTAVGPASFVVSAFNAQGDYVGVLGQQAVKVHKGVVTDLGTIGVLPSAAAYSINASGQIVGTARGDWMRSAFVWDSGTISALDGPDDSHSSDAAAINAAGMVAGTRSSVATIWDHGAITTIGALPPASFSYATAINTFGDVAGVSDPNFSRAFLYRNGTMMPAGRLDPYGNSQAAALNDADEVVGAADVFDPNVPEQMFTRAYVWRNGETTNLGALQPKAQWSEALSINNSGVIVGSSDYEGLGLDRFHAFVVDGGAMRDLNTLIPKASGWILDSAVAIDDAGRIVGTGTLNGEQRSFVLTKLSVAQKGRKP